MNIDKNQILELLRSQGDDKKAQQADQELPDQVDIDRDAGLLSTFGIDPMDQVKKLGGGGGPGGLLGGCWVRRSPVLAEGPPPVAH
jgi:hypothetical protein